MAVFTIADGGTLRMDRMLPNGSSSLASLIGLYDGSVEWRWANYSDDPVEILYQVHSTGVIFTPPFSDPEDDASFVTYSLGDITLDLQFFDPAFGPGPIGTLTGTTWQDVTLVEHIEYVNLGGLDPLQPAYWYYELSFDGPVLFGGGDTVTLGDGDDVFYDYGGALVASLGGGNDEAHLYEAEQGVTDVKFVDAGDGNDQVYCQSGIGTILGGAGNDTIGGEGNNDGNWILNGGRGDDVVAGYNHSRIEDDRKSGDDAYEGSWQGWDDELVPVVLSYARGRVGMVIDVSAGTASGGEQGSDTFQGIYKIEGTRGGDTMIGTTFDDGFGHVAGVTFWGLGGADTMEGYYWHDAMYGGDGDDQATGYQGDDRLEGGNGNDALDGGEGRDTLSGGAGDDTLTGSFRADTLDGGASGADVFVYLDIADSTGVKAGRDIIRGFDLSDVLDFSAIDADTTTAAHEAFVFIGQSAFTYRGQIRFEHQGGNTVVYVHNSGGSNPEMRIDIAGIFDLTEANFI